MTITVCKALVIVLIIILVIICVYSFYKGSITMGFVSLLGGAATFAIASPILFDKKSYSEILDVLSKKAGQVGNLPFVKA
ncbi:Uncharacterised protein [uncultured archaeon]|nr:Uncharacterised protein [uncultured archaeon]